MERDARSLAATAEAGIDGAPIELDGRVELATEVLQAAAPERLSLTIFSRRRGRTRHFTQPAPSIEFDVVHWSARDVVVASGRTGPEGVARLEVPHSAIASGSVAEPQLAVLARGPGLQPRATSVGAAPDSLTTALLAVVQVQEGSTRLMHVVDPSGQAVSAKLLGVRWRSEPFRSELRSVQLDVEEHAPGRYGVHWVDRDLYGGELHVVIDAGVHGTAALALSPVVAADEAPIVAVVRGPAAIRGRVVDRNGRGVVGLCLRARLRSLTKEEGTWSLVEPAASVATLEGGGALEGLAHTDGEGRFEFGGLREAAYVLRILDGRVPLYDEPLAIADARRDGEPLRLVHHRAHLWIRYRERASGATPAGGRSSDPDIFDAGSHPGDDRRLGRVRLGLARTGPIVPVSVDGRTHGYRVDVLEGRRYVVAASVEGYAPVVEEVAVPAGASSVEVDLQLDAAATGQLEIAPTVAGEALAGRSLTFSIEDLVTGAKLADRCSWFWDDPPPWTLAFPEGRYRVIARGDAVFDDHGNVIEVSELGAAESTVQVRAGERVRVILDVPRGGYLDLDLRGAPRPADVVAARDGDPYARMKQLEGESPLPGDAALGATARVSLLRPERAPLLVEWLVGARPRAFVAGESISDHWPLGGRRTSLALPPGEFLLVATTPSGRTLEQPVLLIAGETLQLDLNFGN